MSVYMTEEEQIQAIKKWWMRYNTPILVLLSLIMLTVAGVRYWNWHEEKLQTQASNTYERMMVAFSNKNTQQIQAYANQLIKHYSQTVYADVAKMINAKLYVEENQHEKARELLMDVALNAKIPAFKQVAKIRVARLLVSANQFDQALNQLNVVDDLAYMTIVNELKGDIFVQKGDYQQAIRSYKKAIEEAKSHGIGNLFLEMKTNDIASLTESKNMQVERLQTV